MSFALPFYGPSSPLSNLPKTTQDRVPMTVTLAGVDYPIELAEYRRGGLELLREQVATSSLPDDQLFDNRGRWWRYRFNFVGGEGARIADMGDRQDPLRYWKSRGVDPWDEYELKLLPSTFRIGIDVPGIKGAVNVHTRFFFWTETTAYVATNIVGNFTAVSITGMTGDIRSAISNGVEAIFATSTNLFRVPQFSGSASLLTSATPPDGGYDGVWFVANRVIASSRNRLYEVKQDEIDLIVEHYFGGFRWKGVFAVGSRIYAACGSGRMTEIMSIQTLSDGSLAQGVDVSPPAADEELLDARGYGGIAIIATSRGIRIAVLAGDATLVYGPLIRAPGRVDSIVVEDRFCWFSWPDFPDGGVGLGRLDLSLQSDLQPAYAPDVFTEEHGPQNVVSVVRYLDRTVFVLDNGQMYACYSPIADREYVTEGYLDTGEVYFGAIERKVITESLVRFDPLEDGQGVAIEVRSEPDQLIGTDSTTDTGAVELKSDLDGYQVTWARLKITLTGPGDSTPVARMWRLSAFPASPATQQWVVPIIIHEQVLVNDGPGEVVALNVEDQVDRFAQLWADKRVFLFSEGSKTYPVRIDNYEIHPRRWDDNGNYYEVKMLLRLYSL